MSFLVLTMVVFATIAKAQGPELQPSAGNAGSTLDVALNGASFGPEDVTITFQPPGLTVRNLRLVARQLVFTLDVGAHASGNYAMILTPNSRAAAAVAPIVVPNAFRVIKPVRTPPLVTSITPESAGQGASLLVRIGGLGFQTGASVKIGTINASVMSVAPAEVVASVVISPDATPGERRVIVRNPDGLTNESQPRPIDFTITATTTTRTPPPATPPLVTSITPESAAQGASLLVRIGGLGFQTGASVKIGTINASVMSVSPGEIVANVVIPPDATPGERRVTVRNPDGLTSEGQPRPVDFTITAATPRTPPPATPPLVTSITPASAAQGATLLARIAGSGFQTGATVRLGIGVNANVLTVTPGEIVANVVLAADATPGARRVVVRNPNGLSNESQPRPVDLTITTAMETAPPTVRTPPVVTSIAPSSTEQGTAPLVRIAGSGFQTGANVSLGNGVSATVVSLTAGEIVANVRVASDATPGPHRVVVRNPDGLSNESQPRPVDLTITTARVAGPPVVRTPPVVTSIAPDTLEQGASPLARIAGSGFETGATVNLGTGVSANVISVTASEIVATLGVAATATPGAHRVVVRNPDGLTNEGQPQPVDLTITAGKVIVKPPFVPPPTASVKGPRVDAMKPQKVMPGSSYTLDVEGKNFSADMKIALGKDITILGVPIVLAPTKAKLQVLVLPAAKPGVVVAVATSAAGENTGPGGVMIGSAVKTSSPPTKKAPPPQKPPIFTIKEPTGSIKLLHPCDAAYDETCTEMHMLDDATEFDWKEVTPGIAQLFVFEIVNAKESVLYTAQTTAPFLEWSGAKLTSLFEKIAAGPAKQASPGGGTVVGAPMPVSGGGLTGTTGIGIEKVDTGTISGLVQGQAGVPHKSTGTPFQMLAGTFPDAVFWRVRGLRAKTGKPKEMYVAEESDARPLSLPKTPNGFSCPVSSKSKLDLVPVHADQYASAPCETKGGKYSTHLCSGMTARFSESSTLDMTKVPFEFVTIGQSGWKGNLIVQYGNVFVDWGDGSEPSPLSIQGGASDSLAKSKLAGGHEHKYVNSNTSSEYQDYPVRIYAVADDSKMSLLDLAKAAQKSATGVKGVHTLACTSVRIWNQIDLTKEMPLTLVSAITVFPDDWAKIAALPDEWKGTEVVINDAGGLQNIPVMSGGAKKPPPAGGKPAQSGGQGIGSAGNVGDGINGAPSGSDITTNIPTYGIDTSSMSKVSECAEAFRPFVRIHYWGRGRARIRWTLDGKVIEERETSELPPVTYNDAMYGKMPYDIDLTIPLPAKYKSGANIHYLKVHVETGKPPKSMASATGNAPVSTGMTGMTVGSAQLVSSTTTPVSGGGPTLLGETNVGGADSSALTPGKSSLPMGFTPGAGTKLKVFDPGEGSSMEGPYSAVDAKTRGYEVVKKLAGVPCRIIYKTVNSGTLYITDITDFQLDKGSSSGKGKLKIVLPGVTGSTTEYAGVVFDKWKLQPKPGQETDFDAISGSLSGSTAVAGIAMNFPVRITAVSLNPERLLISGGASLPASNLTPELDKMPEWPFANVIMPSGGRFAFTSSAKRTVGLGSSQFKFDITAFELDLNSIKAPSTACSKTAFSGALVSGLLRAPQAVTFGKSSIFADVNVEKWAVKPFGLSVQLPEAPFGTTVKESAVTITTSDVSFSSCEGGYATKFQLAINGIKFFSEGITGDGSLDAKGNLLVALHPATAAKAWTNADIEVSSLSLHRENEKNWYFLANGSFAFRSHGKPFQKVQYEKMTLGFDGKLLLPSQAVNNVEQTTTSLAGFPYTITKFTASNSGSALKFTFTGDIKFAEHVPSATNRDVTFSLPYKNASLTDPPATLLADMPLFDEGPVSLLTAPPDEGGGGEAEPEVQAVDIELQFPPGAATVIIKAKCTWTSSATGYRFTTDDGSISVMDSLEIQKTRFVFGNDNGESYWLAQASFQLPTPMQLGTTPLYLFAIGGGIGHNVDITSFNAPVQNIVAAHSANYLFSADVDVGTLANGETFWSNGRVTVQFNDGFAVRADLKAWLLTTDHAQPPAGVGCMMYSGGAFTAGFGVHYEQAGLVVDAPAGPDPCQGASVSIYFAGPNDFHVTVGTPTAPVSAQVAGVKGSGAFSFDPSGANLSFTIHYKNEVTLDIGICTAHAGYEFYWGMGAGFTFDPFSLSGSAAAGAAVGAGCGIFDVGAGGDVSLSVTLPGSAKICGALHIFVNVLGDKYWLINTGEFCA